MEEQSRRSCAMTALRGDTRRGRRRWGARGCCGERIAMARNEVTEIAMCFQKLTTLAPSMETIVGATYQMRGRMRLARGGASDRSSVAHGASRRERDYARELQRNPQNRLCVSPIAPAILPKIQQRGRPKRSRCICKACSLNRTACARSPSTQPRSATALSHASRTTQSSSRHTIQI